MTIKKQKKLILSKESYVFLSSLSDGSYVFMYHRDHLYDEKFSMNNQKNINISKAVILYVNNNYDVNKVAELMGISTRTVYNYLNIYKKDKNFFKKLPVTNVSDLQLYLDKIVGSFEKKHVKTYKQAQQRIEEITGIHRGQTQIRAFLINNFFVKSSKGYFYQQTSSTIRTQLKERNKKIRIKSILNDKGTEIENYVYKIASRCNYDEDKIVQDLIETYHLIETESVIKEWLKRNTTIY